MAKKTKKFVAPLIEVRQRKGAKGVMVGANTEVLLDGKPLRGATKVTFEVCARGVAKLNVEFLGRMAVSGKIGEYSNTYAAIETKNSAE